MHMHRFLLMYVFVCVRACLRACVCACLCVFVFLYVSCLSFPWFCMFQLVFGVVFLHTNKHTYTLSLDMGKSFSSITSTQRSWNKQLRMQQLWIGSCCHLTGMTTFTILVLPAIDVSWMFQGLKVCNSSWKSTLLRAPIRLFWNSWQYIKATLLMALQVFWLLTLSCAKLLQFSKAWCKFLDRCPNVDAGLIWFELISVNHENLLSKDSNFTVTYHRKQGITFTHMLYNSSGIFQPTGTILKMSMML